MANKPGQGRWKKGEPGNPYHKHPTSEMRHAAKLSKTAVAAFFSEFMGMGQEQLQRTADDPTTPAVQAFVAQILLQGIKRGDPVRLNFLLDRIVGKVSDRVEHIVKPFIVERLDGPHVIVGADTVDAEIVEKEKELADGPEHPGEKRD